MRETVCLTSKLKHVTSQARNIKRERLSRHPPFCAMFAPWPVRLFNSFLSFTLLVFTIPLAFDVGGRDCGLVWTVYDKCWWADLFFSRSDILFLSFVITAWITTFKITMVALSSQFLSNSHYSIDFGVCVECFYYKFCTIDLDSSHSSYSMGLDID